MTIWFCLVCSLLSWLRTRGPFLHLLSCQGPTQSRLLGVFIE